MKSNDRKDTLTALSVFTGLTVVFTYPSIFHISDKVIGDGDVWTFLWNLWWMKFSLLNFLNPFFTDYIFYPVGDSLFLHAWNYPLSLLSIPLQALWSPITIYNIFCLFSFILAGYGMYRLARYFGIGFYGALLAGIAFSFCPYHFSHLRGHFNLIHYQWIPFFILSCVKGFRDGWSFRRTLETSGWLVLVALTDWYYFVFCTIGVGLFCIEKIREGRRIFLIALRQSVKMICLCLLILSPFLIGMISEAAQGIPEQNTSHLFSADLLSFFIPGPVSSFGGLFEECQKNWTGNPAEWGTFIPWSMLLFSIWGWRFLNTRNPGLS